MEYYDQVTDRYLNLIERGIRSWRVKLELVDHFENTVLCIEGDIDYSKSGNIQGNNAQGTRKSCSLSLINVNSKYVPSEDNPFWYNRKFRFYLGLVDYLAYKELDRVNSSVNETDTYWFSKGVFITQEIHCDSTAHTVSISGIDKYAQLDGTLNVLQADEMNTVFEYGASVNDVVRDILSLDMGNGMVLDPIDPLIDPEAYSTLYKEYTLSAGQYYGDFLNELATSMGCEIFYDTRGRLNIRKMFADDFPYWVGLKAPVHEFKYHIRGYENPQETIKLTGVNKIIVSTDNVETPNASYTAINHNPRSPLCYDKIGARTLPENGGVVIINAGNIVDEDIEEADPTVLGCDEELILKRCRDYGEYRLMQETCISTSISFNCPPYLHFNEGDVIAITDPDFGLDCDLYVINSITFNLNTDSLSLEVSNLGFLNSDLQSLTQFSPVVTDTIKFGIHYDLGTGVTGTVANQLIPMGENFTAASDVDSDTHEIIFSKNGYELVSWSDNIHGEVYVPDTEYAMPNQYFTLTANWASVADYTAEIRVKEVLGAGYPYGFKSIITQDSTEFSEAMLILNNQKYYFWGRNYESQETIPTVVESNMTLKFLYVPLSDSTLITLSSVFDSLIQSGTNGGKTYYIKYPNAVQALDLSFTYAIETIILPSKIRTLNVSPMSTDPPLKFFDFNNEYEVTMNYSQNFLYCRNELQSVTANAHVIVNDSTGSVFIPTNAVNATSLPDITFAHGLKINNTSSSSNSRIFTELSNDPVAYIREITIGQTIDQDEYKGGLELNQATFLDGGHEGTKLTLGNTYLVNTNFAPNNIGEIVFNGNTKFLGYSIFISGTQFTNTNLRFRGKMYWGATGAMMASTNIVSVRFDSDFIWDATTGGGIINGNNSLQTIDFYGAVDIQTGVTNTCYFMPSNSALTTVSFYDSFHVQGGSNVFISYNSNLTDVYFYNDDFSVSNSECIFANNNANFKLHGIANGNVQAYATANNIPFEVISNV